MVNYKMPTERNTFKTKHGAEPKMSKEPPVAKPTPQQIKGNWDEIFRPTSVDELDQKTRDQLQDIIESKAATVGLFGGVGRGKTTLARIIANHYTKHALDIKELSAGTSGGIEDIREMESWLRYNPIGDHKIAIIDEMHALSAKAVSGLLKIAEEPGSKSIIIGCTSEQNRVPFALRTRFGVSATLAEPSSQTIFRALANIAKKVGRNGEEWKECARTIAKGCNEFRTAIKTFQRTQDPSKISIAAEASEENGSAREFIDACIRQDAQAALRIVRTNKVTPNNVYSETYAMQNDLKNAKHLVAIMHAARLAEVQNLSLESVYMFYAQDPGV